MNDKRYFFISFAIIMLYWGFAAYNALNMPLNIATSLFSESGAYEVFSPWLWFLLAMLCLCTKSLSRKTRAAAGITALLLGFREMDLHKALFEMSFLKSRFYFSSDIAVYQKLIGLSIILLALVLAVYLGKTFYHSVKAAGHPLPLSRLYILLSLIIFVISKFFDRLNTQLNELFGIYLPEQTVILIQSLEESSEMLVPIILCVAVLIYRKPGTKPHNTHPHTV